MEKPNKQKVSKRHFNVSMYKFDVDIY